MTGAVKPHQEVLMENADKVLWRVTDDSGKDHGAYSRAEAGEVMQALHEANPDTTVSMTRVDKREDDDYPAFRGNQGQ